MKTTGFGILFACALAIVSVALLCPAADAFAVAAQAPEHAEGGRYGEAVVDVITKINHQPEEDDLSIMTKVIQDSIDQVGLENWHRPFNDLAIFGSVISADYIPTVGAVFTIPVNFPIVEPKTVVAAEPAPAKEGPEDLWEKHAGPAHEPGTTLELNIDARELFSRPPSGAFAESSSPYDKTKVEKLRAAIIGALAKYACHLEDVNDSERILVIIEAPKGRGEHVTHRVVQFETKEAPEGGVSRSGAAHGAITHSGMGGGTGGAGAMVGGMMGGMGGMGIGGHVSGGELRVERFMDPIFGGPGQRDRLLLVVSKADVREKTTPEALEGKIQEINY